VEKIFGNRENKIGLNELEDLNGGYIIAHKRIFSMVEKILTPAPQRGGRYAHRLLVPKQYPPL